MAQKVKVKMSGIFTILAILAVIGAVCAFIFTGGSDEPTADGSKPATTKVKRGKTPTITIGVNTYAGFTPIVWLNGGLKPNDESILTKDYGVRAKIVIQDDFVAGRNAFQNGDIDLIYCTTDVLAVETGEGSAMNNARYVMMLNRSQGADAIVVNRHIKTVSDLKGKKIAVAEGTASHTLLLNTLETSGLTQNDVRLVKVDNGGAAADAFKAGQVDACVTWSPDDQACVKAIVGAHVLVSTKDAKDLVTDGLLGRAEWLDKNRDAVERLISAILWANSRFNKEPKVVDEGARIFASAFQTDAAFAKDGCGNVWFATLEDEENFLGLNAEYNGVTASEIYSKMAKVYADLNLTKKPLAWRKVSDVSFIEHLSESGTVKGDQSAQPTETFAALTAEQQAQAVAISNKKLTINFDTNSDKLGNTARALIDKEFVPIAKQYSAMYIRIEGNTDNTGSAEYNKALSYRRAKAVADYLANQYDFDPNRFIIVGNGPKHAIDDYVVGPNVNYRTTDFMLVGSN